MRKQSAKPESAKTRAVKPHILSWLQPAPKTLGKMIELSPSLSTSKWTSKSPSKRADSLFITRSCLGGATASGLLGMHRKPRVQWGSKVRFMLQIAAAVGLVSVLSPTKSPNMKVASQPKSAGYPMVLKTFPGYSGGSLGGYSEVTVRN